MACPYLWPILPFIVVCRVDDAAVFTGDDISGEVTHIIYDDWFAEGEDLFDRDGGCLRGRIGGWRRRFGG